jgi:hypothetical protein
VFIVHGRADGSPEEVARFVARFGLRPIILPEPASEGRTIIEKIAIDHAELAMRRALHGRVPLQPWERRSPGLLAPWARILVRSRAHARHARMGAHSATNPPPSRERGVVASSFAGIAR